MSAWEYLRRREFLIRYNIVKSFLDNIDQVLSIVDLNCGEFSPLLDLILEDVGYYYGNDINLTNTTSKRTYTLDKCTDVEAIENIGKHFEHFDVLVLMGDGAGEHTGEKVESETALDSFFKIVDKYQPEHAVYECITSFESKYGRITNIINQMDLRGYNRKYLVTLTIDESDNYVGDRTFVFFKKHIDLNID